MIWQPKNSFYWKTANGWDDKYKYKMEIQFIKNLLKRRKVLLPKWENKEKREIPSETRGGDQVSNKCLPSVVHTLLLGLPFLWVH